MFFCRNNFPKKINGSIKYHFQTYFISQLISNVASKEIRLQFTDSRSLKISTGKLAKLADGSAVATFGDTNVMATVVGKNRQTNNLGFVPLTVDYRQKSAAAGRIPTHHLRREIGITEKEILTSRLIDRSIRPLFPKYFNWETQVVCNLLSLDGQNDPDVLAINATSAALALSDIPWNGPIGAVRVSLNENFDLIFNPTRKEMYSAKLNLIISTNESGNIIMLEAFANEPILEQHLIKVINKAIQECKIIIEKIKQIQKYHGKEKRTFEEISANYDKYTDIIRTLAYSRIWRVFVDRQDKILRDQSLNDIKQDLINSSLEEFDNNLSLLNETFYLVVKEIHSDFIIKTGLRSDGRTVDQLRPIFCEVDLFKPVHGSALFQRGQTQVLCTATLDSLDSVYRTDHIAALTQEPKEKNFMLHYEFPQFATNDIGRSTVGRREIGHGALAERALKPVIPTESNFTTRLLCEVLESNGSSSMASVCAGSLALLDAGINITEPVAGIAIGLINKCDQNILLTDITGFEDYFGEMDLKIAGTKKAFTALQLDFKLKDGLPFNLLYQAIQKSNTARSNILNLMTEVICEPRRKPKENMPIVDEIEVPLNKRSKFLGVGWSNAKRLMAETGINITQDVEDINKFIIFAPNKSALLEAKEYMNNIFIDDDMELEFGAVYKCKLIEFTEDGAFVEIPSIKEPIFIHLSHLDVKRVRHPSALDLEIGATICVKYFGRDPVSGRIRISRKALQTLDVQIENFIN